MNRIQMSKYELALHMMGYWWMSTNLPPARSYLQRWDPIDRQRPVSAYQDVMPAWNRAMGNPNLPMDESDRVNMITYHHLAYLDLREGVASYESFDYLALTSNLCLILCELGYGEEWMPLILETQDAMMRARARGATGKSWRLDGRGLASVSDMLDVYDAQLEVAPRRAITRAREIIMERLAANEILEMERK